jgi:iron complex transport system ATP-binding protein
MNVPPSALTLTLRDVVVDGRLDVPHLSVGPGLLVVVGENGAGKSTLLDVLAGIVAPNTGTARVDGVSLSSLSPRARACRIASLGQRDEVLGDVLVAERIAAGLAPRRGLSALFDDEASSAVAVVAAEMGIEPLLHRRGDALSGGQRRRVSLARTLVDDSVRVLVLDEPFAGLDVQSTHLVVSALRKRAANGHIVVVSVHDVATALALGGRLLGLRTGTIVVDGALPEILPHATAVWGDVRVVVDGAWVGVLHRREGTIAACSTTEGVG